MLGSQHLEPPRPRTGTASAAAIIFALLFSVLGLLQGASAATPVKSDNVRLIKSFEVPGATGIWNSATDIDFSGRYAYVGRWNGREARGEEAGGIYIFDIGGAEPKKVSFIGCPGSQNDVAVVKPGLLALGYHRALCGVEGGGVTLVDVADPKDPEILGSVRQKPWGTHTLTAYPGKPLIYASPGGWGYESEPEGGGDEYIIDVSNPRRPKVVATFDAKVAGCHDLSFRIAKDSKLAFCAGDTMTQIWDVADPLAPVVIANLYNPLSGFNHSAEVSSDGKLLAVGEEAWVDDCAQGFIGSIWFWDISDPSAPRLLSHYSVPRGDARGALSFEYTCSAHNFKFIPGTHILAASWFQAGMNVLDVSDPTSPTEIAHYVPDRGTYWSAYWHQGRIYASGVPGLDVLEVTDLKVGN